MSRMRLPSSSRMLVLHLARDEEGDVLGQLHPLRFRLLAEDRDLRLDVGGLDVRDEAPLEAAVQPLLEGGDLARRAVARDHDLLLASWRALKMWKNSSWVRSLPAMNWMSSTSSTSIDAVLLAEGGQPVEADGVDHLVDEAVRGDVEEVQLPVARLDVVADRVHQVGLAEPHAAVDEERVVGLDGDLGHRARGGVRELVRGADHEALERVLRVEREARRGSRSRGSPRRRRRPPARTRTRPAARARPSSARASAITPW